MGHGALARFGHQQKCECKTLLDACLALSPASETLVSHCLPPLQCGLALFLASGTLVSHCLPPPCSSRGLGRRDPPSKGPAWPVGHVTTPPETLEIRSADTVESSKVDLPQHLTSRPCVVQIWSRCVQKTKKQNLRIPPCGEAAGFWSRNLLCTTLKVTQGNLPQMLPRSICVGVD